MIRHDAFAGEVPRRSARLLSAVQATLARNVNLYSGELRAWRDPLDVFTLLTPNARSIHLFQGLYWFEWANDVSVVRGAIAGDTKDRTYYTGDGVPKVTDSDIALPGTGAYPRLAYNLGVPAPASAPIIGTEEAGFITAATNVLGTATTGSADGAHQTPVNVASTGGSVTITAFAHREHLTEGGDDGTVTLDILRGAAVIATKTVDINALGRTLEPEFSQADISLEYTDLAPPSGALTYTARVTHTGLPTSSGQFTDATITVTATGGVMVTLSSNKRATGTATFSGNPADNDTLTIGATVYRFKNALAAAYDVKIGATAQDTVANLIAAINDSGVEGVAYGNGTVAHSDVTAAAGATTLIALATAKVAGYTGNTIVFEESSAVILVSGPTLTGTITFAANPADNGTVTIGAKVYRFKNALVTANDIKIEGIPQSTVANLVAAINGAPGEGTKYGTGTTAHADVSAAQNAVSALVIDLEADYNGNSVALSDTDANITVSGAKLAGQTLSGAELTLVAGDKILIADVTGMTDLNGEQTVTSVGATGVVVAVTTSQIYAGGGTWRRTVLGTGGQARVWVYTYVAYMSGLAQEGPPSPASAIFTGNDDEPVSISGFAAPPANHNITKARLYRTSQGEEEDAEFLFVAEFDVTLATYLDNVPSTLLGEAIASEDWEPPPADLRGLIELPGGVLAGISGNQVCFSEPFQPHAWPVKYQLAVLKPVALGAYGSTCLAVTEGEPRVVEGPGPGFFTLQKVEVAAGCVSARGAVDMGTFVIWPTGEGLWLLGPGIARLVTEGLFTAEDWAALKPETLLGCRYNNWYLGFYDTGATQAGFMFDPRDPVNTFTRLSLYARGAWTDPRNGDLYLIRASDNHVVKFDGGAARTTPFEWESREWVTTRAQNPAVGCVEATTYPVTFSLYSREPGQAWTLRHNRNVTGSAPFRINMNTRSREWKIRLQGTGAVKSCAIAESMQALDARVVNAA